MNQPAPILWVPHPTSPVNAHNPIPYYSLVWDATTKSGKLRRIGNAWTDKARAEEVFRDLAAKGRNPVATVKGIAGFAF